MKVAVIGLRGFPDIQGGIEIHCQHLYPRLVALGCQVTVYGRSPYTGKKNYEYQGVNVVPLWSPRQKFLEAFFHTLFGTIICGITRPDIIHFHATGPSIVVPLAKLMGLKIVATHHGFDYDRDKWGRFAKMFIRQGERHLCRSHAVIVISPYIQESILNRLACQSVFIANGVNLPNVLPAGEYCKKYGIQRHRYFLFAGRFVPEKNIDDLILAFSGARTSWKLVIAGAADHEDAYSRKVMKLIRNTSGVIPTGFIRGVELQEIYSNAGCFVLPSSHEGLPIALLEALSYGLPCIASDIPANRSIGYPAITYFPPGDIGALTSNLEEKSSILEPKIVFLDQAACDFVAKNFNWDEIAHKTMAVYNQVLLSS